jgi:hypothetical protein
MGKKKYTDIYIAEDSNGLIRISCERDNSLANARWRSTKAVTIYGRGNSWAGSCRMTKSARKEYYRAGLTRSIDTGRSVYMDGAICAFAQGLVRLEELGSGKADLPRSADLCLGTWNDDNGNVNLVVRYRGILAKALTGPPDYPSNTYTLMLAVYCGGKLNKMVQLKHRAHNKQVAEIAGIIDEVADGRRKRNSRRRGASGSRASSAANRRTGR